MKKTLFGVLLFLFCTTLVPQQVSDLQELMSHKEFKAAGLHKLTESERKALMDWIYEFTSKAIKLASRSPVGECSPAIESTVDGEFEGWEGETIVKLTNGQIWQQVEYTYDYTYGYLPEVLIYSSTGGCKMVVEGMDKAVGVRKLR